jgi:hypothetical protein
VEKILLTFPAAGHCHRDPTNEVTVSLTGFDLDDGLVTVVTFDCFLTAFFGFGGAATTGFGFDLDTESGVDRADRVFGGTLGSAVISVWPTLMVYGELMPFRAAKSLKSIPSLKAMA